MKHLHPGFQKVTEEIAKKQGIPKERAAAILAASSRKNKHTSSNPRLKRVKG